MASAKDLVEQIRANPHNVRFADLERVCEFYFGPARQRGSHLIYKTPWPGDPRINIQRGSDGKAKIYQVRQVLKAIEKKQEMDRE